MLMLFFFFAINQFIWEQLYQPTATGGREQGTLYHLRQLFKLVNVPSSVKKNYSACEALMLSATKAYLCSAFMTWAQISSTDASPSWFDEIKSKEDPSAKWASLQEQLGKFVDEFVMIEFDIEKTWHEQLEQRRQQREQQMMGHESAVTGQTMPADRHQSHNAAQDAKTPGL